MDNRIVGVAVVTGAQGGLGRAIVTRLLAGGYAVVAADAATATRPAGSDRLLQVVVDIADEDAVEVVFKIAVETFGYVSLVVNNAATQEPGDLLSTDSASFRRVIDVNVTGSFLVTKAGVKRMLECGGAIVNVASVLSLVADGDLLAYTCSKSALLGLTRAVAVKYAAAGIRCNAVCPGDIDTAMSAEYSDFTGKSDDGLAGLYPMGRIASVDEIASAIVFLGSDDSSYITGQTLVVDGGLLARCY